MTAKGAACSSEQISYNISRIVIQNSILSKKIFHDVTTSLPTYITINSDSE